MFEKSITFGKKLWVLLCPYWRSEERWLSGAMIIGVFFLCIGHIYMAVLFNDWQKYFFNAMQNRDIDAWLHQLVYYVLIKVPLVIIEVYKEYLCKSMQIRWRRWLSERYIENWIEGKAYWQLEQTTSKADNPDQRIAEDLRLFVDNTIELIFGMVEAVLQFCSFAIILWTVSGVLYIFDMEIYGYLLWAVIIYAAFGSRITHFIGQALRKYERKQQQYEADYRFSLVRMRENAKEIAVYSGEKQEKNQLSVYFCKITENWWKLIRQQKSINWFTKAYEEVAFVVPYLLLATRYFSGAIPLGVLIQSVAAFHKVRHALFWFIEAYKKIAIWGATVDRLIMFTEALAEAKINNSLVGFKSLKGPAEEGIVLENFSAWLPDNTMLVRDFSLHISPGNHTLIYGPSGAGKSTLFQAINGLWPYCSGTLILPKEESIMFLPQKPYMPITSLRQVLLYPGNSKEYSDSTIREVMQECNLAHLVNKLDDKCHWGQQLSLGEQQCIAIVRAIFQQPQWLFLDEATSALDQVTEMKLYGALTKKLPHTTLICIAHKQNLVGFYQQKLDFPGACLGKKLYVGSSNHSN